jgi:hypothetical protein
MKIGLNLEKLSQQLTNVAQQAYPESGALKSSIKVEVTKDNVVISFLNYGLFQDAGVQGAFGTKNPSGRGYSKEIFKYKAKKDKFGRPAPVGGNLNWGARVNIRKFGIPAKPWIAKMITNISEEVAKDSEINLNPQIEFAIVKLLESIK